MLFGIVFVWFWSFSTAKYNTGFAAHFC